jgi:hypothetical protein
MADRPDHARRPCPAQIGIRDAPARHGARPRGPRQARRLRARPRQGYRPLGDGDLDHRREACAGRGHAQPTWQRCAARSSSPRARASAASPARRPMCCSTSPTRRRARTTTRPSTISSPAPSATTCSAASAAAPDRKEALRREAWLDERRPLAKRYRRDAPRPRLRQARSRAGRPMWPPAAPDRHQRGSRLAEDPDPLQRQGRQRGTGASRLPARRGRPRSIPRSTRCLA